MAIIPQRDVLYSLSMEALAKLSMYAWEVRERASVT